jgi:hypothetical protein
MRKISFDINIEQQGNQPFLKVNKDFPKELLGVYVIRELNAQEAIDTQNAFIAESKEAQDNPDKVNIETYTNKMIETATTINGEPFKMPKLETVPKKYYDILVAAFEKLNGISNAEASFLLKSSS